MIIWIYWKRFRIIDREEVFPYLFITQSVLVKILCGVQAPTLPVLANVIAPILRSSSRGHCCHCHGSATCLWWYSGGLLASAAFWNHFCDVAASSLRSLVCPLPWTLASTELSPSSFSVSLMWPPGQPRECRKMQIKGNFSDYGEGTFGIL